MMVLADIYAPLMQAQRCLDQWLSEEDRALPPRLHARASALMARYFQYEDRVSDQLMLSFLRHYSGLGEVDLEDPQSVRLELKTVLDKSIYIDPISDLKFRQKMPVLLMMCTMLLSVGIVVWMLLQKPITFAQQNELRATVARIADEKDISHAAVWSLVKKPLGVTRYQDINWYQYGRAQRLLQGK